MSTLLLNDFFFLSVDKKETSNLKLISEHVIRTDFRY